MAEIRSPKRRRTSAASGGSGNVDELYAKYKLALKAWKSSDRTDASLRHAKSEAKKVYQAAKAAASAAAAATTTATTTTTTTTTTTAIETADMDAAAKEETVTPPGNGGLLAAVAARKEAATEASGKKHTGKRKRSRKRRSAATDAADEGDDVSAAAKTEDHITLEEATVFVDGIPYEASEDDLRKIFGGCGEIISLRMPRYQDSGRARGYAHVEFGKSSAVKAALKLDKTRMGGRYLNVKVAKTRKSAMHQSTEAPKHVKGCKRIFVKNLPYDGCDEAALREAFTEFGEVKDVRMARWNHTGRLKGFGYVDFAKAAEAIAAVESFVAKGKRLGGRAVVVDYDTGAAKAGFKDSSGRSGLARARAVRGGKGGGRGGRSGFRGPRL